MKTFIAIAAAVVLTLSFGLAYADEVPTVIKNDVAGDLYLSEFPSHDTAIAKDFGTPGGRPAPSEAGVELGKVLNDNARDIMMGSIEARGSAAGGMREDENTRIWDKLLAAPVSTIE